MRDLNSFTASFSIHLFVLATLVWLSSAAVREAATPVTTTVAPPALAPTLDPAVPRPPDTATDDRVDVPNETGSTVLDIPNFSFDFTKIASRAARLFPFLTDGMSLEPIRVMAAQVAKGGLVNPYSVVTQNRRRPPLAMSDRAMQALVDRQWSRRERWRMFQPFGRLMERHHANDGELPALLRRYSDQNFLQPYVDTHVRDPRLWTMLGIAADHADFIELITRYATAHPGSKTTIELLFMLEEMAQGSRDALLALLEVNPQKELWWTRHTNEDAYQLVVILQRHYRAELEELGIATEEGTTFFYDSVRLGILAAIMASTPNGYRADDARFLIGSIYWRNDRHEEAIDWWRNLRVDPSNRYADASRAVLDAIPRSSGQPVNARAIHDALDAERRKWAEFWWERLREFGHSLSTF